MNVTIRTQPRPTTSLQQHCSSNPVSTRQLNLWSYLLYFDDDKPERARGGTDADTKHQHPSMSTPAIAQ